MRFKVLLVIVSLIYSCGPSKATTGFVENVVIAHRGAWKTKDLPENSIAALKNAVKLGCKGSEFDIRMTEDNTLIVTHDPDYANLLIEETTYQELSKFPLKNGEVLPTLRQYLFAGLKNNSNTKLVCEIKPSKSKQRGLLIAEKVLRLVEELKAQDMVLYISFSYDILKRLEELDPNIHTQYLDGSKSPEKLKADGIDGADYHYSVFKKHPEWIASAKKNNISLNAWTVDKTTDIDWLLKNGFDFITTNEPELVLEKSKVAE